MNWGGCVCLLQPAALNSRAKAATTFLSWAGNLQGQRLIPVWTPVPGLCYPPDKTGFLLSSPNLPSGGLSNKGTAATAWEGFNTAGLSGMKVYQLAHELFPLLLRKRSASSQTTHIVAIHHLIRYKVVFIRSAVWFWIAFPQVSTHCSTSCNF